MTVGNISISSSIEHGTWSSEHFGLAAKPIGVLREAVREQFDIEHVRTLDLLGRWQEVEEQRSKLRFVEQRGDEAIAGTVAGAAASVSEDDERSSDFGNGEVRPAEGPDPSSIGPAG